MGEHLSWLLIAAGIALLIVGGDVVVRGAGRLALAAGLSPLVVGLTVVAFCTSAPELAASLVAASRDQPALAVGNVVGSNIANIGLILGIAGLLRPIPVRSGVLLREMPLVIGAVGGMALLSWDGALGRLDGGLLLAGLAAYVIWMLRTDKARADAELGRETAASMRDGASSVARLLGLMLGGVGLLVLGAELLVRGAVAIATASGLSARVIGLTVVAIGTSLPELASSVVAVWRRQGDLVLGNVLGSNVFNVLGILGLTALVRPIPVDVATTGLDLWVLALLSLALIPMFWLGGVLRRGESAVLLAAYAAYTAWLLTAR